MLPTDANENYSTTERRAIYSEQQDTGESRIDAVTAKEELPAGNGSQAEQEVT